MNFFGLLVKFFLIGTEFLFPFICPDREGKNAPKAQKKNDWFHDGYGGLDF
jgi:hypothetical protein